jgi:hypothetical protein
MWGLRFKIYDKLESLLLEYRALYEIFTEWGNLIYEIINEGKGLEYNIHGNYPFINERVGPCYIEIRDAGRTINKIKVDIVGEVMDINTNNYTVSVRRKVRSYEENSLPVTLREDKPCMLAFLENNIPLLSVNLFCRVDLVDISEDYVNYILGIPSSAFRYQFLLLKKYFEMNMFKAVPIFLLGVDANLLHLELRAIDVIQRTFDEEYVKIDLEHKDMIKEQIKDVKSSYESTYFGTDAMLIPQLREIIRLGNVTKGKKDVSQR